MKELPKVLEEVILCSPVICPRRFSRGAARDKATVSGLAPGREVEMLIVGRSTLGNEEIGKKK